MAEKKIIGEQQMKIEAGKIYWKTNDSVHTIETLKSTLEDFGVIAVDQRPQGNEYLKRIIDWRTPNGMSFSTIWYCNYCDIRFGNWSGDLAEIAFNCIRGANLQYSGHDTIVFTMDENVVFTLALLQK